MGKAIAPRKVFTEVEILCHRGFREFVKYFRLRLLGVAVRLGIPPADVRAYFNGRKPLTNEILAKLVRAYDPEIKAHEKKGKKRPKNTLSSSQK